MTEPKSPDEHHQLVFSMHRDLFRKLDELHNVDRDSVKFNDIRTKFARQFALASEELHNYVTKPYAQNNETRARKLKGEGKKLFKQEKYLEAQQIYSKAIELNPRNPVFYSNRAAVYSKLKMHQCAIEDAETAINIDPNFVKAYVRKGVAQMDMNNFKDAYATFVEVTKISDLSDEMKKMIKRKIEACRQQICESNSDPINDNNNNNNNNNTMFTSQSQNKSRPIRKKKRSNRISGDGNNNDNNNINENDEGKQTQNYNQWLQRSKQFYLEKEVNFMRLRVNKCVELLHKVTETINKALKISQELPSFDVSTMIMNVESYCSWINDYTGPGNARTKLKQPITSEQKYKQKVGHYIRNKRGKAVNTLYIELLKMINVYAQEIAKIVFSDNQMKNRMYYNVLISNFIYKLFLGQVKKPGTGPPLDVLLPALFKVDDTPLKGRLAQYLGVDKENMATYSKAKEHAKQQSEHTLIALQSLLEM